MPPLSPSVSLSNRFFTPLSKVRTIFITGLPADVKERELHNLLRWLPGFEASQINFKGEQPMGFALFSTVQYAVAAKDALQVNLPLFLLVLCVLTKFWIDSCSLIWKKSDLI